jgi:CBS domain-containing protein
MTITAGTLRKLSGIIRDPITITPDRTVGELLKLTSEHNISGVPVVSGFELVGIVTSRDVRFEPAHGREGLGVMTRKDKLAPRVKAPIPRDPRPLNAAESKKCSLRTIVSNWSG